MGNEVYKVTIYADKEKMVPLCVYNVQGEKGGLFINSLYIGNARLSFHPSYPIFLKDGDSLVIEVMKPSTEKEKQAKKIEMDGLTYKYPIKEIAGK